MRLIEDYEDSESLKNFLSQQLYNGRLALFLGAGVSMDFGFPNWPDLIKKLAKAKGTKAPGGLDYEREAEWLFNKAYNSDQISFISSIHDALYVDVDYSLKNMISKPLLVAIGALTMSSKRGSVTNIVTLNYDNTIETYLAHLGFTANSIKEIPCWSGNYDVSIFHPHGFIPKDKLSDCSNRIVFTQQDYDSIVGNAKEQWRSLLVNMMSSHTCLFIGLSGDDNNMSSIMTDVKKCHANRDEKHLFWGVRFSDDDDDKMKDHWETRGVYQVTLDSYGNMPNWLLDICQRAEANNH